jgi:hypothetical protein
MQYIKTKFKDEQFDLQVIAFELYMELTLSFFFLLIFLLVGSLVGLDCKGS